MPPSSITAPSSTVALMPTKARFFSVQAWITALWPTVTSSPMWVSMPPESRWITVPSWMLVRAPMRMMPMSPRTRQWNHTPVSDPITTSPMIAAVGAMKASSAMMGVTPFREKTVPYGQLDIH